ncbi:ATP-binding protein [Rhodococcus opacus]|nr:ATP-binding protein [Rhodococcus opacus]
MDPKPRWVAHQDGSTKFSGPSGARTRRADRRHLESIRASQRHTAIGQSAPNQLEGDALRIESVGIVNFRCLDNVEVAFSDITTFIGPNGAGKSSVLRALDWFFNGGKLDERDVWSGHDGPPRIRVRVTFTDLTEQDREALGPRYAPPTASTFTAWRTWESGEDKMSGSALAFPPFEAIRSATSAATKKTAYNALRDEQQDLDLPKWTSASNVDGAMEDWERDHPDRLSDAESGVRTSSVSTGRTSYPDSSISYWSLRIYVRAKKAAMCAAQSSVESWKEQSSVER